MQYMVKKNINHIFDLIEYIWLKNKQSNHQKKKTMNIITLIKPMINNFNYYLNKYA